MAQTKAQLISGASSQSVTFNDATVSSINGGPIGGARNRIINGDMRISQRATTATGNYSSVFTYASVDRWAVYSANTNTTQAQSTDAPAGFQNSFKLQRPSGATGTSLLAMSQAIEAFNCNDLSGKNVTLSFWAKRGANFSGANLEVLAVTGTTADQGISSQDSWSGRQTPIIPAAFAITTTWTQYSFTGVFGANIQEAAVRFQFYPTGTAGADDSIYITGVQLEAGSVATPFERRSYGQELALCQRYYYKMQSSGGNSYFGTGYNYSTTGTAGLILFPVTMRTAPSALEQSGTAGDYRIAHGTSSTTCSSVPIWDSGDVYSARVAFTVASGLTTGQGSMLRSVNSTAYLAWSAEL